MRCLIAGLLAATLVGCTWNDGPVGPEPLTLTLSCDPVPASGCDLPVPAELLDAPDHTNLCYERLIGRCADGSAEGWRVAAGGAEIDRIFAECRLWRMADETEIFREELAGTEAWLVLFAHRDPGCLSRPVLPGPFMRVASETPDFLHRAGRT